MNKKKNLLFYAKFDNYFYQVFLVPSLIILCAALLATLRITFGLNDILSVFLFFIFWTIIGRKFPAVDPLQIIVGYYHEKNRTELSIWFRRSKISGVLTDIYDYHNSIVFAVNSKWGESIIAIPHNALPYPLLNLLKETILDINHSDFLELQEELLNHGYRAKIREAEEYYNMKANQFPGNLSFKLIVSISSLIIAYIIAFHLVV